MTNLTFFTISFFNGLCSSINYHLIAVIRSLPRNKEFKIFILSLEDKRVKSSPKDVLGNFGFPELYDCLEVVPLYSLDSNTWFKYGINSDIVFCQHYLFYDILHVIKQTKSTIKIISWMHSISLEEYLSSNNVLNFEFDSFRDKKQDLQCKISDVCVFDSEYDYNLACLDFTQVNKAVIVYPITQLISFDKHKSDEDVEILFIGRWDYRKGFESLIPCSYRLFLEHGISTVILTNDFHKPENVILNSITISQFKILINNGGLKIEPWKHDKKEYSEYLSKGNKIAVFPSYYDPFNMAAYDCALAGMPMVVSNRCGICELFDKSERYIKICNPYNIELLYENIFLLYNEFKLRNCQRVEYKISYGVTEFRKDIANLFNLII